MSDSSDANYIAHAVIFFETIIDEIPQDLILVAGIDKQE